MYNPIFRRPWLPPQYPVVFEGVSVGILMLMGFTNAGAPPHPGTSNSVNMFSYRFPPDIPKGTTRQGAATRVLSYFGGNETMVNALVNSSRHADLDGVLAGVAATAKNFDPHTVPITTGNCLEPFVCVGDTLHIEAYEEIAKGDYVLVILRGNIPIVKVFAGTVRGDDGQRVLLAMAKPQTIVSVLEEDILYIHKLRAEPHVVSGQVILDAKRRARNSVQR